MNTLLVVISVLLAFFGAINLTQATEGVGLICLGVAFAIWARLNQVVIHRKEDLKRLEHASNAVEGS